MARYQYRLYGAFSWVSSPGNALLALQNKPGSGKRVTIRSLEIDVEAARNYTGNQFDATGQRLQSGRGTQSGGEVVVPTPMDSNATLPSGLSVRAGGTFAVTGLPLASSHVQAQNNPGAAFAFNLQTGLLGGVAEQYRRQHSALAEKVRVRAGESWGVFLSSVTRTCTLEVTLRFVTLGSPNRTWAAKAVVGVAGDGATAIAIVNGSAGDLLVVDYSVRMLGATGVTPYVQIAPFAAADPSAQANNNVASFLKMDTASPDASTWVRAVYDTPLVPSGAPIEYANAIGAGAPKNANYLQTKDFLGPVWRTFFPEVLQTLLGTPGTDRPDGLGFRGHVKSDLLVRRSGIVLRPGEGLAAAAAAETFGSSAAAIGGEIPILIGISFDVENLIQPYLTLTGLQTGSDIVILSGSTILQQIDAYSSTSWSWAYDSDLVSSVDVCVYKPGFVPLALRNVTTPAEGLSIPIVQTPDRNYS
jgi:hypothetical protein